VSQEYLQRSLIPLPFQEFGYSLLGCVYERVDQVKKIWDTTVQHPVTSTHKNWDTTSYCKLLSQDAPGQYSVSEVLHTIAPNFETFTDEYVLGTVKKTYRYENLNNQGGELIGSSGVAAGYKERLAVQAQRFQDHISKAGRGQQRATIETFNVLRLESWMSDVLTDSTAPIGTKLVWCSVPGHRYEGYQGVSPKHHSFVWVYEKKFDGKAYYLEMTQFRCWPSLDQMQTIQHQLHAREQKTGRLAALPATLHSLTPRNSSISQMIELPPTISLAFINSTLYASQDSWQQGPQQMPDTQLKKKSKTEFLEQRTAVLEKFLLPLYKTILTEDSALIGLTQPYLHQYWTSPEYRHVIAQLDVVLAIAKQSLDRWLELTMDSALLGTVPPVDLDGLQKLYSLKMKSVSGGIAAAERSTFNSLAPQLLSLGNKTLSWGQCGLGTVVPLNLINKFKLAGGTQAAATTGQLGFRDIQNLSVSERKQFKTEVLENYRKFLVYDRNGKAHPFWVLKQYYDEYAGHCYQDQNGLFKGPCQIDLNMDTDEFILTDEKYQELLLEATSEKLSQAEKLRQLQRQEDGELLQASNDTDRQRICKKYQEIRHDLQNTYDVVDAVSSFFLLYANSLVRPLPAAA